MPDSIVNTKRPLWFGFSLAPLAAPLLYSLWALLFWTDPTPKREFSGFDSHAVTAWIIFFLALTITSYFGSIVVGIPLIAVLRRRNRLTFWRVVLSAALIGAIAFAVGLYLLLPYAQEIKGPVWIGILQFSGFGAALSFAVAVVFCLLVGIPVRNEI
jgi:hypothetical protein